MTHVPFTSRLASLMGFPSNQTAPSSPGKYDGSDESYIPYTGTYERPPGGGGGAGPSGMASGAPSSSNHTRTHTQGHAHTHSGSTKNTPSNYSITSGHPYNPVYSPPQIITAPPPPQAETDESDRERERDRGRRLVTRRISTSSSFAAMAPSSDQQHHHHHHHPPHGTTYSTPRLPPLATTTTTTTTSTVNPNPNARRGGPSYLALDGGFIGQSPVAVVSPKEAGRTDKSDKSAYRSSFASFMTFGNSRKSIASGSGSAIGSQGGAAGPSSTGAWPHSATGVSFPHGASKLRGELRPTVSDFYGDRERGRDGGAAAAAAAAAGYEEGDDGYGGGGGGAERDDIFMRLPPLPPYMRQRSQSYVDQTEQGQEAWRRREEDERRIRMLQEEMESRAALAGRNSVKVTMPTSFFDVSPVEEREGSNPFGAGGAHDRIYRQGQGSRSQPSPAQSHPYHRHYQPTIVDPHVQHLQQPHDAFDLTSPVTHSFDFLHPYATAPASTNTSPSKSSKSRPSNAGMGMTPVRSLVLPRKPVPDFQQGEYRDRDRVRERDRSSTNPFPFVNPFSFNSTAYQHQVSYQASPPPSRPITPKGRLKSLVSLSGEGLRTLKGSISTPNLRGAARGQTGQPNVIPGAATGAGGTQLSHGTTRLGTATTSASRDPNDRRASSSRTALPPNSVLQGQTLCDTFFLPRPRFQAHQISPPESPHSPIIVKEPKARRGTVTTTATGRQEHPVQRDWERRATAVTVVAMTRSDPDQERREREKELHKRLGKKKASAPDLRKKPERPVALRDMRRLTEAEKVLLKGEEQDREREEWQRAARGSFQNQRSRSLSRTRTKSFAKASTSAATSGDEKEREREKPSRKNTITVPSSIAVTNITAPGTGPPTATSSSGGAATSGDEGRPNQRDKEVQAQQNQQRAGVKSSMEYLAAKAFSQGYPGTVAPAPLPTHSRHQSGDVTGNRQRAGGRNNNGNGGPGHRRSESWGRSALKMARNSCADPDSISPAIEHVFQLEVSAPSAPAPVLDSNVPRDETVLDIGRNKNGERPHSDESALRPSVIGIAIGTPPLDSLLNEESNRIDHPYSSPLGSPIFVGPHPASPITSLPQLPMMTDVVSRHRLPPRAHTAMSPPLSPDAALASLDAYVPTMEASSQSMLSRESWLVYMNALEEGEEPSRTTSKGKGRAMEVEPIIYEERPSRDVPEDVDVTMDTPELQLDLGLDGSPAKSMRSRIISAQDMEQQLTKAFRRQSANSMSESSDNGHAALTFEAGATLSRLLSSRSVTSIPRSGLKRTISNPETPKIKKTVMVLDPDDPQSTLTQITATRPPIPTFEPMTHHRSSSGGRRISGHSDAAGSASGHDSLWRKSIVSSEFAHSPPSQESSPKASPRTLVNLDDLEGYSDLFYAGGHGSINSRPKSGGSNKTNVSSGLLERALRPEPLVFVPKGSAMERSYSSPESSRGSAGRGWSSGALSPPPPPRSAGKTPVEAEESSWHVGSPSKVTETQLERTWDPEEEEEEDDSYRIGTTRQPIVVRPTLPIHRHSTKLSVIEGSVDEHATASESTADLEDQESRPATSPTRAIIPDVPRPPAPLALDTLNIPIEHSRRTSSEGAVAPEGYARTSMMTNTSGQSRMSDLSDFPVPPIESAAFALTPSDVVQSYFPPRASSPIPPASPASVLSVEPPSPTAEADENEDRSVSEQHQAFSPLAMTTTPVREYRSNRATFGPDADIAREWTERQHSSTPTTEEH